MMPPKAAAAHVNQVGYVSITCVIVKRPDSILVLSQLFLLPTLQSGALAGAIHEKKTAPVLSALLSELEHRKTTNVSTDLNPYELANIHSVLKQWNEATVLTPEVVQASVGLIARASALGPLAKYPTFSNLPHFSKSTSNWPAASPPSRSRVAFVKTPA